jgi:hypothetical protein
MAAPSFKNCRNLRHFIGKPYPLSDVLIALKRSQFGAGEVFADLPLSLGDGSDNREGYFEFPSSKFHSRSSSIFRSAWQRSICF